MTTPTFLHVAAASVDFISFSELTLRTRLTQKKSPPQDTPNSQEYARYSPFRILTTRQPAALNYAPPVTQRRQLRRPNVPGLPPRSPTAIPMPNLELA
jgi:hypothetical protein